MNIDHMLNGIDSNRHHQEMIQQAEHYRLVQEVKSANKKNAQPQGTVVTQRVKQVMLATAQLLVK